MLVTVSKSLTCGVRQVRLTLVVVVTHLGLLGGGVRVAGVAGTGVYGRLGELDVLGVVRNSRGTVDSRVGGVVLLLAVVRSTRGRINGEAGGVYCSGTVDGTSRDGINGNTGGRSRLLVLRLGASTVLTFDVIDGRVLSREAGGVNLN